MARFLKNTKHSSLLYRIIATYIMLAIIPGILVTLLVIFEFQRTSMEQSNYLLNQNNTQREIMINERLKRDQDIFYNLITDQSFIDLAFELNDNSSINEEARLSMTNLIESQIISNNGIRAVNFIASNGNAVSYSQWYDSRGARCWNTEEEKQRLLSTIIQKETLAYPTLTDLSQTTRRHDFVVLMGLPVRDLHTKEKCGILIFALSDEIFQMESASSSRFGIQTLVISDQNKIMYGNDEHFNKILKSYIQDEFDDNSVQIKEVEMLNTGWKIINIIDIRVFYAEVYHFIKIVIAFYILITILFFFVVYRYMAGYLSEIAQISRKLAAFDAGSDIYFPISVNFESDFYELEKSMQGMAERNNELVQTLKQKNEEIQKSEEERRLYEIRALEAQINPHFIYNTLDTINWMAIDNGEEEISNMLGMLGSLLRYSISNSAIIVILRAEIEWLKKYIYLQKIRFNNSFDCIYDITPEAMDFPVYKTMLQPIVENCIIHGFECIQKGGLIIVKACVQSDGRINILIKDNGNGMPEKTLERIQKCIDNGVMDTEDIGISNVVNRLRIYYHGEAEIHIDSTVGKGTAIDLQIPYLEKI